MNKTTDPKYLSGDFLYGDDFTQEEIDRWFAEEAEGYANLGSNDSKAYLYNYHGINSVHAFNRLRGRHFSHVLGMGSAYGDELKPILGQIEKITIIEPSLQLRASEIGNIKPEYLLPLPNGDIPLNDCSVDLITCLGVLHHIPNVSKVVSEFGRVLKPGGLAVIREPVISMGDWSGAREGLTRNERGIPRQLLVGMLASSGFDDVSARFCMFPPLSILANRLGGGIYNSSIGSRVDYVLSLLFRWNMRYHATTFLQKFRPTNVFVLAVKHP